MAIRTKLELEDLVELGKQFGLKVVSSKPVKEGLRNSNYVLESSYGNRYVLRVCDDQSLKQAESLVRLIGHLFESGFPSQKPVFPNGEKLITHNDKPVIVLSYIDGETISDLSLGQLEQLGACMAQMHGLDVPEFVSPVHPFGFELYAERFSGVDHEYIKWFNERRQYFDEVMPADLPGGIVHGDLWYDNAIYHNGDLAGIIDFESGYHGKCIFDIGQTTIGSCRENGSLNYGKVRALVDGYQSVRPLEDREKALLKLGASQAAAVISIWRFYYFNLRCGEANNQRYFEAVKLSDDLDALSNDRFMKSVFGDS